jgi:diketogulonate reductase-like aldo/keto reductase
MPARSDVRRHNLRLPGCWHGGDDIVPIPGTKRRKYLQENIGALDVNLTSADLAHRGSRAEHAVAGERYPDWAMQMVNR